MASGIQQGKCISLVVVLCVVTAMAAVEYNDDCGCLLTCSERYNPEYAVNGNANSNASGVEESELSLAMAIERDGCQKGCVFYHEIISEPQHISVPAHLERQYTHDKCISKCKNWVSGSGSGRLREEAACEGGCRDGCLYFPRSGRGRRPSMRLTIFVEETIRHQPNVPSLPQDETDGDGDGEGIEGLLTLTDPGLKQQIEDTQSPTDVNTKIPSSYYTNMPVNHRVHPHICIGDDYQCSKWVKFEPLISVFILLIVAGMLLHARLTQKQKTDEDDDEEDEEEADELPEKVPLPQPLLPTQATPYNC